MKIFLFIFTYLLLAINFAYAGNYYVSNTGLDTNPGTIDKPWKTLNYASSYSGLLPGDNVIVKSGVYRSDTMQIKKSGTIGYPITFKVEDGGTAIIDKQNTGTTVGGIIYMSSVQNVVVKGFTIVNGNISTDETVGINVINSSNIEISNNTIEDMNSACISVWVGGSTGETKNISIHHNKVINCNNGGPNEHITIGSKVFGGKNPIKGVDGFDVYNNEVYDKKTSSTYTVPSGLTVTTKAYTSGPSRVKGGEGIDAKGGSRNGRIYSNYVHDLSLNGTAGRPCIYLDAWNLFMYNIEIYRNLVKNCGGSGLAIASERNGEVNNLIFHNNVSIDNMTQNRSGLSISTYNNGGTIANKHPIHHILVINNTFYNNYNGLMVSEDYTGIENLRDIVILNNLFDTTGKASGSFQIGSKNILTSLNPLTYKSPYKSRNFNIKNNYFTNLKNAGTAPYFSLNGENVKLLSGSLVNSISLSLQNLTYKDYVGIKDKATTTGGEIINVVKGFTDTMSIIPSAEKDSFLLRFKENFIKDFNGKNRIVGNGIDIGAVEVQ